MIQKHSGAPVRGSYVFTHMMEAPRTDVESCALLKHARGSKVTLLVALQNVVLTGCLMAALYLYWTGRNPDLAHQVNSADELQKIPDVHIRFLPIGGLYGNTILKFKVVPSKEKMDLRQNTRISTNCTGPYILHMYICYRRMDVEAKDEASGTLQLKVVGKTDPLCNFELRTHDVVCRGLSRVTYLSVKEEAEMHLNNTKNIYIFNVTVGFNYLLGSRCDY